MTDLLTLRDVPTAAVDVYYLEDGRARAAAVLATDPSFTRVTAEVTVMVRAEQTAPYEPGEFFLRELPPIRAVLSGVARLGLLIVDGYVADLCHRRRAGRPGCR
jgi:deoxyribonuclease V